MLKAIKSPASKAIINSSRAISQSSKLNSIMGPIDFEPNAKHFPAIKTPMLPTDTFKGRVAYITGGGTGLGKDMAQTLSSLGAKVFITSRREAVLKAAAAEITEKTGNEVAYFPADVRKAEQIEEALDHCKETLGATPCLVINNAAGNFVSPTERLSANAVKTIVDIVLLGTMNTTLAISKRLIKEEKRASFLSIITTYADTGSGFVVPSACSKAGIAAMTKSLAVEWSRYGFRFNGISPGPIYTEGAFSRLDPTGEFVASAAKRIPTGRLGEKEELSNLAAYLLSDYSSWVTGQIIDMEGGEVVNTAGSFNPLYAITPEQWDMMEQMIRGSNKKSKL